MTGMTVGDAEVNPEQHNGYLDIIGAHSGPLEHAMLSMGVAAGPAARSLLPADFAVASDAMKRVSERAAAFLNALGTSRCPAYLRGADSQIQDALKLLVDGGRRGSAAADARNGEQLTAAGIEMKVAIDEMVLAGGRIFAWRSGHARP